MALALLGAVSGLYLTWVRGSRLGDLSAIALSLDSVLIVVAVVMAWRLARQRRFAEHRRWAIRAFLLVSAVWSLRLGLMAWLILNQGPRGNTPQLDGPFDSFWVFGCYLVPLAVAELYFRAERAGPAVQRMTAAVLAAGAALTALGGFGALTMMWAPHFRVAGMEPLRRGAPGVGMLQGRTAPADSGGRATAGQAIPKMLQQKSPAEAGLSSCMKRMRLRTSSPLARSRSHR